MPKEICQVQTIYGLFESFIVVIVSDMVPFPSEFYSVCHSGWVKSARWWTLYAQVRMLCHAINIYDPTSVPMT